MNRLFEKCPACGGRITLTECKCADCQLQMRGEFSVDPFSTLSQDQSTFVLAFLRVRGNLSEMEKVLGVSYPTIRNKLDEINRALAGIAPELISPQDTDLNEPEQKPTEQERRSILQQVADGKLSAAQALDKLQELSKGK
jgi:hypothetical protein